MNILLTRIIVEGFGLYAETIMTIIGILVTLYFKWYWLLIIEIPMLVYDARREEVWPALKNLLKQIKHITIQKMGGN